MTEQTNAPKLEKLVIDGVEHAFDQLSDEAKRQLGNLRMADLELARLRQQQAIAQTARAVYAAALKQALPAVATEPAA